MDGKINGRVLSVNKSIIPDQTEYDYNTNTMRKVEIAARQYGTLSHQNVEYLLQTRQKQCLGDDRPTKGNYSDVYQVRRCVVLSV